MGWYGDNEANCPNCKKDKAVEMYRNNCQESYYLVCPECGLHLFAGYKCWKVNNSYIDKSVIGKNRDELDLTELVDQDRNEDIIPEGSSL